ncbi:hypothetical protein EJ02DRAFT_499176 [Clathrospora elynae]|uniref:Uncharacterized protein n=1 Tax=Clathrospora elynae TaxID=706981 RepID=A0A6A5T621_9PLEO|nr:hypothetical protein EJ02DRAFT_499176 [Clathrospora elynae]
MDDWQDAAFSSRHMHNRNNRSGKAKHRSAFDVRKTFGSYAVKCPAWQKLLNATDSAHSEQDATLELYRLTENGEGVVGELSLHSVLHASVILAGSRDSLRKTVSELESVDVDGDAAEDDENDQEDGDDNADEEESERDRFETFEKNSFRSPKFWFRWSGAPTDNTQKTPEEAGPTGTETELGYMVFSGNDCRKFKGTINCTRLKWKNVALTGHKIVSRSESDAQVTWGEDGVEI